MDVKSEGIFFFKKTQSHSASLQLCYVYARGCSNRKTTCKAAALASLSRLRLAGWPLQLAG
jgi:hypothetical protein